MRVLVPSDAPVEARRIPSVLNPAVPVTATHGETVLPSFNEFMILSPSSSPNKRRAEDDIQDSPSKRQNIIDEEKVEAKGDTGRRSTRNRA